MGFGGKHTAPLVKEYRRRARGAQAEPAPVRDVPDNVLDWIGLPEDMR